MDEWTVKTDDFLSRLATAICETSGEEPPDKFVIKAEIFGIPLTYERIVKRSPDGFSVIKYNYAIYAAGWVIERSHDPVNSTVKELGDVVWKGRGSFEQWQKDASLLKLSGI